MKLSSKVQASLNKVIERFKSGDLSAITRVVRINLDKSLPASKWSFTNRVLAYAQAGELDCRGFRQWQSADRQIKRGSKAVYILRPKMVKKEQEEKGETKESSYCIGFSFIPVFSVNDTEGEGILPEYQPRKLPPLHDIAKYLKINIKYLPVSPDKLGDCNSIGSRIRLGSKDESVFFHELAHAIHAKIEGRLKKDSYSDNEVVAEFTATVLMDCYGIRDHSGNAWKYIKHYSKQPILAISKALAMVEKVLKVIEEAELAVCISKSS